MEIESFYYSQFNDRDTVLIVDDAEVNREILKLIFEEEEHEDCHAGAKAGAIQRRRY